MSPYFGSDKQYVVGPRGGCGTSHTTRTTKWQYVAFTKKRSGSETRKRGPKVDFRVTDEERARIEAAASRAGLTVGSCCRARALTKPTTRAVKRAPCRSRHHLHVVKLSFSPLPSALLQPFASRTVPPSSESYSAGRLRSTSCRSAWRSATWSPKFQAAIRQKMLLFADNGEKLDHRALLDCRADRWS
jgi:hypothetical protein